VASIIEVLGVTTGDAAYIHETLMTIAEALGELCTKIVGRADREATWLTLLSGRYAAPSRRASPGQKLLTPPLPRLSDVAERGADPAPVTNLAFVAEL
jgi:hypothetical protein